MPTPKKTDFQKKLRSLLSEALKTTVKEDMTSTRGTVPPQGTTPTSPVLAARMARKQQVDALRRELGREPTEDEIEMSMEPADQPSSQRVQGDYGRRDGVMEAFGGSETFSGTLADLADAIKSFGNDLDDELANDRAAILRVARYMHNAATWATQAKTAFNRLEDPAKQHVVGILRSDMESAQWRAFADFMDLDEGAVGESIRESQNGSVSRCINRCVSTCSPEDLDDCIDGCEADVERHSRRGRFEESKRSRLRESEATVELTTYTGTGQIPHDAWPDGTLYKGKKIFDIAYGGEDANGNPAIQAAEKELIDGFDGELDMQECYLGYDKQHDQFIMGYDGWWTASEGSSFNWSGSDDEEEEDEEESGNCSPYIVFKVGENGDVTVTNQNDDMSDRHKMWYGKGGGYDAVRQKFPGIIDIRLD